MRCWFTPLFVMSGIFLSGCCTTYPSDVPPEHSVRTPHRTIEYLRWAYSENKPQHAYNCLSDHFRDKNDLSLGDLATFWPDFRDAIDKYVGSVEKVEVIHIAEIPGAPRLRDVHLRNGPHRAVVRMTLQTSWEIRTMSPRIQGADGQLESMTHVMRQLEDGVVIRLPESASSIAPEDVHSIQIENAWKIWDIVDHNLEEIEAEIRNRTEADGNTVIS